MYECDVYIYFRITVSFLKSAIMKIIYTVVDAPENSEIAPNSAGVWSCVSPVYVRIHDCTLCSIVSESLRSAADHPTSFLLLPRRTLCIFV